MSSQEHHQEEKQHSSNEQHPLTTSMAGGSASMPPPPLSLGGSDGFEGGGTMQLTKATGGGVMQRAEDDNLVSENHKDFARAVINACERDNIEPDTLKGLKNQAREMQRENVADNRLRDLFIAVGQLNANKFAAQKGKVLEKAIAVKEGFFRKMGNDQEAQDHGHSIDRHGPEVTDTQLVDRLKTGVAPDGAHSPAPGLSTKFVDYETWVDTKEQAITNLNEALVNTLAYLRPYYDDYIQKRDAYNNAAPGPHKAHGQPLHQDMENARALLEYYVQTTHDNAPQQDMIPVYFAANAGDPLSMISTRPNGYTVIKEHGKTVGTGFRGTTQNADNPQLYDETEAADPLTQTRTGLEPNDQPTQIMGDTFDTSIIEYRAFQHFPSEEPDEGIRI